MKNQKSKSAFSMIELVFVIAIIGILAAVAIPRLAATRDDAEITKARVLVASIRNSLAMERQKRILRGDFTKITSLGNATYVFDKFSADNRGNSTDVLEYPILDEKKKYHWTLDNTNWYAFCLTDSCEANNAIWFRVIDGKFICNEDESYYRKCATLGLTAG